MYDRLSTYFPRTTAPAATTLIYGKQQRCLTNTLFYDGSPELALIFFGPEYHVDFFLSSFWIIGPLKYIDFVRLLVLTSVSATLHYSIVYSMLFFNMGRGVYICTVLERERERERDQIERERLPTIRYHPTRFGCKAQWSLGAEEASYFLTSDTSRNNYVSLFSSRYPLHVLQICTKTTLAIHLCTATACSSRVSPSDIARSYLLHNRTKWQSFTWPLQSYCAHVTM